MMEPERIDLSALDPTADALAYERWVRRILAGASPELARRAAGANPLALLAGWARPGLAAAAVIGFIALGAILATDRATGGAEDSWTVAGALGLPEEAAEWLTEEREPSEYDLVLAVERRR